LPGTQQRAGLGADLVRAIDAAVEAIAESPAIHALVAHLPAELTVRRARIRRFPYSLPFVELEAEFRILAVAHDRRRPRYWRHRMPGA
jgi:plasmid stabilization system protein ParE